MRPIFLSLLLFLGCQPLHLPPSSNLQTLVSGESRTREVYFLIQNFHDTKFTNDPFYGVTKSIIEQKQGNSSEESEATIERWTIESITHKSYIYLIHISIIRSPLRGAMYFYKIIAVNGVLLS